MKTKLLLAMIVALLIVPMFQAMGQAILRDPNIPDTVRLGCPVYKDSVLVNGIMQLPIGDTIAMPIYVFNDELIPGFSLGFIMDTSRVTFLTFKLADNLLELGMTPQKSVKNYWPKGDGTRDSSKQSIIVGGVDMTEYYSASIPPVMGFSANVVGTIFLKINAGAKAGWYDLDSAQVGFAGYFVLSGIFLKDGWGPDVDSSFSISPQYYDCGTADFRLGGGEVPVAILSVNPDFAYPGENLWVSIVGQRTNFGQGSSTTPSVWLSQNPPTLPPIYADQVNVSSLTHLDAHFAIPADAPGGYRNVSVQNSGDASAVVKPNGFFIKSPPSLQSINPDNAYPGDTLQVTITGVSTNFIQSSSSTAQAKLVQGSSVITALSSDVLSSTLLTAWFAIPFDAHLGLWDVVVNPVGGPVLTLANGFNIHGEAALLSLTPAEAAEGQSLWVTFSGRLTHFDQGGLESVFLSHAGDSIIADSIAVISADKLSAFFRIREMSAVGLWDATVRQSGFAELTLTNAFTVKGTPPKIAISVTSLSDSLLSNETATQPLVISNLGGEPLKFRVDVAYDYGLRDLARKCLDGVTMTGTKSDSGRSYPTFTPEELERFKANLAKYEASAKQSDAYRHYARFAVVGDRWYDLIYRLMSDSSLVGRYLFFDVQNYDNYDSIQGYDALIVAEPDEYNVSINKATSIRDFYNHRKPVLMGMYNLQYADEAVKSALFPVFGIIGCSYEWSYNDSTYLNTDNPITRGVPPFMLSDWGTSFSVADAAWICRNTMGQHVAVSFEGTGRTALFSASLGSLWDYGSPRLVANAVDWLIHGNGWLVVSPDTGTVGSWSSANLDVVFSPKELSTGNYSASMMIASNDSVQPEISIPVALHVTGAPSLLVSRDTVHFGNVFVGGVGEDTLIVYNEGTSLLTISEISSDNADFTPGITSASIESRDSLLLPLAFHPGAPGAKVGVLTINSDDQNHPIATIVLDGIGMMPPIMAVTPSSLADSLLTGDSSSISMTISNSGAAELTWQIEIEPAEGMKAFEPKTTNTPLEVVLQNLDQKYQSINSIIPNRFDFSEGETGYGINDGGGDMYDGGNYLLTNLGSYSYLNYSNDSISHTNFLGVGGRYFTRKFPGLFVFAADLNQVDSFRIEGNLGADGAGSVDGVVLQVHKAGTDFLGFVKRVYSTSKPSVNHLIIVKYDPAIKHTFSTYTNDDLHQILHMNGVTRLYYLLYSGKNGQYINDNATRAIMEAFLGSIGLSPGWVSVEPESGSVPAGGETQIRTRFDAASLEQGVYQAALMVSSNDPLHSDVPVPATLFVTNAPDIELSADSLAFDSVFVGDQRPDTLIVRNRGTAALLVSSVDISGSLSDFGANLDHLEVAPGDSGLVIVTFLPQSSGDKAAVLTITSNDADHFQIKIPLAGVGVPPPGIRVTPSFLADSLKTDETSSATLTVANTGAYRLDFRADVSYSEKLQELALKCVEGISFINRKTADGKSIPTLSPADSAKFEARLQEFYAAVKRLPGADDIPIIAVVGDQNEARQTVMTLMSDSSLSREYLFYQVYDYSSYSLLKSYDGIIFSDYYPSVNADQATAIAAFVRANKPLLMTTHYMSDLPDTSKAILFPMFGISTTGTGYQSGGDSLNRENPITKGVTNFSLYYSDNFSWFTPSVGEWIFSDRQGRYYGVSNELQGRTVLFGVNFSALWYTSSRQLVRNSINWMMHTGWVALDQWNGSVAPGQSFDIGVTFKPRDLLEGDHEAQILFSNNVPGNSSVTIPAYLHVTGVPDILVSDSAIDFGMVFVGVTKVESLLVVSSGSGPLKVASITSGSLEILAVPDSFTVAPHDTQLVVLSYTPTAAGHLRDTLRIVSNDPDQPLVEVFLRATSYTPPDIGWTPDAINDSISPTDTGTAVLTLSNTGGYPLSFEIEFDYPLPDTTVLASARGGGSKTEMLSENASVAFAHQDTAKIAVVGNYSSSLRYYLQQDSYLDSHYVFYDVGYYSNYDSLTKYDGMIVEDYSMSPAQALVVSQFFYSHRPVLVGIASIWNASTEVKDLLFPVLGIHTAHGVSQYTWGALNTRSPITSDIMSVNYSNGGSWFVPSGAEWIFADSLEHVFGVSYVGAARSVAMGVYLNDFCYYGNQRLVANAIDWMMGRLGWMSAKPVAGTIVAGGRADVSLSLYGTKVDPGDFSALVKITSNDPDESLVDIPVHLRVQRPVICGDADGDGIVSASDMVFLVRYLFVNGTPPDPLSVADVNCDNKINLSDVVYLVNYVFTGGPAPCAACK